MVTKDQLKHLSKLSKIDLTENEFETYTKQIEKIIKYLDKLDEISFEQDEKDTYFLCEHVAMTDFPCE